MQNDSNISIDVSVIVSVYKYEQDLERVLDALVNQTLKNIEIILFDPNYGKEHEIINAYAKKYDNIQVVLFDGRVDGLGELYNFAISIAKGKYITLFDDKCLLENNMFEYLLDVAEKNNADLIKIPHYIYDPIKNQNTLHIWHMEYPIDIINESPKGVFKIENYPILGALNSDIWSYLYKRDLIKNIKFNESEYSDASFLYEVFCKANSIMVLRIPLIHRISGSIATEMHLNVLRGRELFEIFDMIKQQKEILIKYEKYEALQESFWAFIFSVLSWNYNLITPKYKKLYLKKIRQLFIELKNDYDFKYLYLSSKKNDIENIINGRPVSW